MIMHHALAGELHEDMSWAPRNDSTSSHHQACTSSQTESCKNLCVAILMLFPCHLAASQQSANRMAYVFSDERCPHNWAPLGLVRFDESGIDHGPPLPNFSLNRFTLENCLTVDSEKPRSTGSDCHSDQLVNGELLETHLRPLSLVPPHEGE